ncbi:hypothetical protein HRR83_008040 [Exophiala dermatitidis]|uniref:Uncharacterized protein n=1 Tax=Exophiala dermatitidis TaxID=5970 RepID=A0AAN6ITD4_EXODE|nr:hypothetical protein HRR74_008790 [Exophiala dermatitidis]KAJ4513470.1 hypothetical protein HRR73_005628 [Exophiala dermatitidis]KAJ4535756.1 hypothetical protein HRR77_007701 [Exophiala dermatitidis]KAJ4544616.1 hypothetical protein HRR76_002669 [Exophiala dermatitidis]KAJ4574674.1 hypothetical protein HRR81_004579 [Exophiala dermatitidis]
MTRRERNLLAGGIGMGKGCNNDIIATSLYVYPCQCRSPVKLPDLPTSYFMAVEVAFVSRLKQQDPRVDPFCRCSRWSKILGPIPCQRGSGHDGGTWNNPGRWTPALDHLTAQARRVIWPWTLTALPSVAWSQGSFAVAFWSGT